LEHLVDIAMDQIGSPYLTDFLFKVLIFCIFWGVMNLLPIYPLDGGQIAREVLLVVNPRDGIRQSLLLSIFTAAGFAVIGLVQWKSWVVGILFGYLAFTSYTALQAYRGRGRDW
jgi:stage IV sporulation protein FB